MKTLLFSAMIVLFAMPVFSQDNSLPKEWTKGFEISISHSGSMSGGSSSYTFTYDSCTYIISSRQKAGKKKKFALTQSDRKAILKKLRDLNVDKIKEGLSLAVQKDGWSDTLCYGGRCIEGGSASEMSEKDKNAFLDAYRYLENFAKK